MSFNLPEEAAQHTKHSPGVLVESSECLGVASTNSNPRDLALKSGDSTAGSLQGPEPVLAGAGERAGRPAAVG